LTNKLTLNIVIGMIGHAKHEVLYPGYPIPDEAAFQDYTDRFPAPPTISHEAGSREIDFNLVKYLLGRTAFFSPHAETIGTVDEADRANFSRSLPDEKRSATIHIPGSDYAIPPWAAQFGSTITQIVEHEHATNPSANDQVAQIRCKQPKEQRSGTAYPHLDMTGSNVRDYHIFLATDRSPTTTFEGRFTYEPHPYPGVEDDPLGFFRDLDTQLKDQVASAEARVAIPYDILALDALTVHQAATEMPPGRTLLGVQFYKMTDK